MRTFLLRRRVQIIAHCVVISQPILQTELGSHENIRVIKHLGCRWYDSSEDSDWPTATTRSKQSYLCMKKAWEQASHVVQTRFGARLSHNLIRRQLALRRMYSVHRRQDCEQSTFSAS